MKASLQTYAEQLESLKSQGQLRTLPEIDHQGKMISKFGRQMFNMSSNDYLGLANDSQLREEFLSQYGDNWANLPQFTSSSSRLLTGSFQVYGDFEREMAEIFGREASLLFNSGYHANIGILPALTDSQTLILADKLVHASIIDGIKLSSANFQRYRHNDLEHLAILLEKAQGKYQRIIIVTESLFSMDGDISDLKKLVELKNRYDNTLLYVDEAHAIGCFGERGLGLVEEFGVLEEVDLIVGTFGKAMASMGAYLICDQIIKDLLVNKMRSLIFSTALPPICIAWSYFLFKKLPEFKARREQLHKLSNYVKRVFTEELGQEVISESYIIPYIIGENQETVDTALALQQQGYYCLPIRPPTVPPHTSRIRLSLTADMSFAEIDGLLAVLKSHQQSS